MACDAQSISTVTKCYLGLSAHQLLASWASYVCQTGGPTPPESVERITEEGNTRQTEEGNTRVTE